MGISDEIEKTLLEPIPVHIVGTDETKVFAAEFGAFRTFGISTQVQQILPRKISRDRAVIWISSETVESGSGIILNTNRQAAQAGMGGLLNQPGQMITIENQQPLYAIAIGDVEMSLSILDETWRETNADNPPR